MTPGELYAEADVREELEEEAWLLVAWQTAQIGPRVWSDKPITPYELLGWQTDAEISTAAARAQRLAARERLWDGLWQRHGGTEREH